MIYADHNATTPLGQPAQDWIRNALDCWGNPSSTHRMGRKSTELLSKSRDSVAARVGADPLELAFTSGGSEANTLALWGSAMAGGEKFRILTSPVEHSSVRDTVKQLRKLGHEIAEVRITPEGTIDFDHFEECLQTFRPQLISLMTANNETGVIFPIPELAKRARELGMLFHTDAVQALGKLPSSFFAGCDLVSVSAHKIKGPKGVGALITRNGVQLIATHFGGQQELKRRGGTENLMGIAGFAGACEALPDSFDWSALAQMRDRLEERLLRELEGVTVQGKTSPRLANTSNVRIEGIPSEVLLSALDLDGVCVSAGSACSSGSVSPSHVLLGMGFSEEAARECLRISWGRDTTPPEVDTVAELMVHHVSRIRTRRGKGKK